MTVGSVENHLWVRVTSVTMETHANGARFRLQTASGQQVLVGTEISWLDGHSLHEKYQSLKQWQQDSTLWLEVLPHRKANVHVRPKDFEPGLLDLNLN